MEHGSGKKFELKLNICEKSKKYSVGEVLAHGFRDTVTYFHYDMPIYTHSKDERASFRFVSALLHVTCGAKQADIARAFGIPKINIKRAVKLYRASGTAGFFEPRTTRGAAVLTEPVLAQAQSHLDCGLSPRDVATLMEIKADTLIKAIRAARLHVPQKKTPKPQ